MPSSLWKESVVRLRGTTKNDTTYGDSTDWDNPERLEISPCQLTPKSSTDANDRQFEGFSLIAEYGTDIRNSDRIEWTDPLGNVATFEVAGAPMHFRSPSGRVSHVRASLEDYDNG